MDDSQKDADPDWGGVERRTGADAIHDLAEQARTMGDRAVALEKSTLDALNHQVRRWRRTTAVLAVGLVILFVMTGIQLSVSNDNKEILKDVDVLVEFVKNLEEETAQPDPQLQRVFEAVLETREIICTPPTDTDLSPDRAALCESSGN